MRYHLSPTKILQSLKNNIINYLWLWKNWNTSTSLLGKRTDSVNMADSQRITTWISDSMSRYSTELKTDTQKHVSFIATLFTITKCEKSNAHQYMNRQIRFNMSMLWKGTKYGYIYNINLVNIILAERSCPWEPIPFMWTTHLNL